MRIRRLLHHLLVLVVVFGMLLAPLGPAVQAQDGGPIWLPLVGNGTSAPANDLLFRTRVTVKTPAAWRDLERLAPLFLNRGEDWALLLVDDAQLETLAALRFNPDRTSGLSGLAAANGLTDAPLTALLSQAQSVRSLSAVSAADTSAADQARAGLVSAMHALPASIQAGLAAAADPDADGDGLTDTQELFWCTDPTKADSDFSPPNDGVEVANLKAWMNNERAGFPSSGKPFLGWPPQKTNCYDDDQDSVPDLAEINELGLSASRESTDRDKFDDGQELFGLTYCTGQGGFCSYGPLPRNEDWGIIFAEMPSWVKAPGNHPLVAAYPEPEVDINLSSFYLERVTEITTSKGQMTQQTNTYETTETQGTSSSIADTKTWNDWEETSTTTPIVAAATMSEQNQTSAKKNGLLKFAGKAMKTLTKAVNIGDTVLSIAEMPLKAGEIGWQYGEAINKAIYVGTRMYYDVKGGNGYHWPREYIDEYDELERSQNTCTGQCGSGVTGVGSDGTSFQDLSGQNYSTGRSGRTLAISDEEVYSRRFYPLSFPAAPQPTKTESNGHSWGGSQTTTSAEYEEHSVTNGEAFTTGEDWSTATAVNSAHAADLWFTYKVRNTGNEYAREIANLAFNVYIGDDPNPAYTYFVAADIGGSGKYQNFMPNEEHTYTSRRIPLSLEQMKAIEAVPNCDELRRQEIILPYEDGGRCPGGPIRIVVEDFTYGIDELFYQDAANAGVLIALEDGTGDGNETIDTYLIPTWTPGETVLNVLARYFPHETDANGTVTAIWTPEYRSDTPAWCQSPRRPTDYPAKALWCKHQLSTAEWWNVYTDGLGDGSEGFQDTPAAPGAVALFRFNQDRDLDGFSDRSEIRLGTDAYDASSFPRSEMLAGLHNIRAGNRVTSTLSLLNSSFIDGYGVEAVIIAPDDSVSITNNTVGGSGRVRSQQQVIVGSRIVAQSPLPAAWGQANHAVPGAGGYYTGPVDRTYTFTVANCPVGGCAVGSGTWTLNWSDGKGATGSLNFGAGYASPNFLPVGAFGLTLALYTGNVSSGDSFTVAATTPRDTFQYTINREPYTAPLVIVSYNDPQGNHRFVLPSQAMNLTAPTDNLRLYAGQMLADVGVEIVTSQPFVLGSNSLELLVNNPSDKTLAGANLFLEFVNISGTVVSEVATPVTLPPGPTYTPVSFSSADFDPAFDPAQDYIVMAFLTDYQGNILDTAGRPLSSFQTDPLPRLAVDGADLTWDFGSAAQGSLLKHSLDLSNVGYGALYTYLTPAPGLGLALGQNGTVGAADQLDYSLTLRTADAPVGVYDQTVAIQTSDPLSPTLTLQVVGTITPTPADAPGGVLLRPLDVDAVIAGDHTAGEWVNFTHNLGPDAQSLRPMRVYSQDYGTLYGVGKYNSVDLLSDTGWIPLLQNGGFEDGNISSWQITDGSSWQVAAGNRDTGWMSMLQNGGFDTGNFSNWQIGSGNWRAENTSSCNTCPYSAVKEGGTNPGWIAQEINLSQYQSLINVGAGSVDAYGHVRTRDGGDKGRVVIQYKSGASVLATYDSGYVAPGNWEQKRDTRTIPAGTDRIRFEFWLDTDSDSDCKVDSGVVQVRMNYADSAHSGSYKLKRLAGTNPGSIYQDISLAAWQDLIVRGTGVIEAGAWLKSIDPNDQLRLQYSFFQSGQVISSSGYDSGWVRPADWLQNQSEQPIPVNADSARITLSSTGDADAVIDDVFANVRFRYPIVEQIELEPYTSARLKSPENFSGERTYKVQYGRRLSFPTPVTVETTIRLSKQLYSDATLDALVNYTDVTSGPFALSIDFGNDGTLDWIHNTTTTFPATLNVTGIVNALNAYLVSRDDIDWGADVDVPVRVVSDREGEVLLTNLVLRLQVNQPTARAVDVEIGADRPLDWPLSIAGNYSQGAQYDFTHTLGPDAESLHPCTVYDQSGNVLKGVGKYCTDLGQGTASYEMFGDGRDGDLVVASGQTAYTDGTRTQLLNSASVGSTSLCVGSPTSFQIGDEILIIQTQGTGVGKYEFGKVVSIDTCWLTLQKSLQNSYATPNSRAQILRVPHYRNVTIQSGGKITAHPWDGTSGGIVAFRASGNVTVLGGTIDATGLGFRVNTTVITGGGNQQNQGEGNNGWGGSSSGSNGTGGGGGKNETGDNAYNGKGAGGGGHATSGGNAHGAGGGTIGQSDLIQQIHFGGAGGHGGHDWRVGPGNRQQVGDGGGIIILAAAVWDVQGNVEANGEQGQGQEGGNGGGAGGSIFLTIGQDANTGVITALGGAPGIGRDQNGGAGGFGRIRIEYCNQPLNATNPPASVQKLDCYSVEQLEITPYTTTRLYLPDAVNGSQSYLVQYARRLVFNASGEQTSTLRLNRRVYGSAALDLLVSNAGAASGNLALCLDVGNDSVCDYNHNHNASTNFPATLEATGLAEALNNYLLSRNDIAWGDPVDVPVRLTLDRPADVMLTDLALTPLGAKTRFIRLEARSYAAVNIDLELRQPGVPSGPLAFTVDVGADGIVDWSYAETPNFPAALQTGNLADAINAYLAGKSGNVDVPLRIHVSPDATVTLNDFTTAVATVTDLTANAISVTPPPVGRTASPTYAAGLTAYRAGDSAPVQATLGNTGNQDSGPVTAAFFATAAGWGDWYIGSDFFANIPAGGTVQAQILWDTTGFSGTVPLKVVVNPYGRVAESDVSDNGKATSVFIEPPPLPPVPDFVWSPSAGPFPLTVVFTDTSSGEIDSWQWDFGDGASSPAQNPTHIYTASGLYTVTLTVNGPRESDTAVRANAVAVSVPPPPVAHFSASQTAGSAPLSVQFTDQSGGLISSRQWDFGDGETSSAVSPAHTYAASGVYTATLSLMGPGGGGSKSVGITVSPAQVSVSIPLTVGWNLVALPNVAANTPVGDVLSPLAGKYSIVFAYTGCDVADPWKKYDPAAFSFSNDLKTVDNTRGLWIKMSEAVTLTVVGPPPSGGIVPICDGWNLVAAPTLESVAPATLFAPIAGCYSIVFAYQAADVADVWKKFDPAAFSFSNDLKQVEPGVGLWVKATQACTWTVGE